VRAPRTSWLILRRRVGLVALVVATAAVAAAQLAKRLLVGH
jgi:hypothetical protein